MKWQEASEHTNLNHWTEFSIKVGVIIQHVKKLGVMNGDVFIMLTIL